MSVMGKARNPLDGIKETLQDMESAWVEDVQDLSLASGALLEIMIADDLAKAQAIAAATLARVLTAEDLEDARQAVQGLVSEQGDLARWAVERVARVQRAMERVRT